MYTVLSYQHEISVLLLGHLNETASKAPDKYSQTSDLKLITFKGF